MADDLGKTHEKKKLAYLQSHSAKASLNNNLFKYFMLIFSNETRIFSELAFIREYLVVYHLLEWWFQAALY